MTRGACIRCGLPPVPGHRYCEECAPARNPAAMREYEPPCSEECHATCLGRISRIEDDVRHILERMTGHDGQVADVLKRLDDVETVAAYVGRAELEKPA